MAPNAYKKTIIARLYVKTPYFMKHVDTVEAPNVEFIDVAIYSQPGIGWMSDSIGIPQQGIATFMKRGYDPVNNEYFFVNESR